jgi:hypothetical protein
MAKVRLYDTFLGSLLHSRTLLPSLAKPSEPLPVTWVGTHPMVVPLTDTNPTVVPLVDIGPTVILAWKGWVDPRGSTTLDDVIAALFARASTLG